MRALLRWIWARSWRRWVVFGMLGAVIGTVASVEVTSTSGFCNSCHIMGPYYDSWQDDTHADVSCIECHISPGAQSFVSAKVNGLGQVVDDLLNRTSTKPSASVSQLSCTREGCHRIDNVIASSTNAGRFKFSHEAHYELDYLGIDIRCSTCHSHVRGDRHFELNSNVCITCHMLAKETDQILPEHYPENGTRQAKLKIREENDSEQSETLAGSSETQAPVSCAACHDPPTEVIEYRGLTIEHVDYMAYGASCESCHRGATAQPAVVDDAQCLQCHVFGMEQAGDVSDLHRTHSEGRHKVECFNCHGVTRHGAPAESLTLEQFDCRSCHQRQHVIQRETYLFAGGAAQATDKEVVVSPMFLTHVDCTGCHIEPQHLRANPDGGALVAKPTARACDNCHQEGLGERMIPEWQGATRKMHAELTREIKAYVNNTAMNDETAGIVEHSQRLLDLIRLDGSWGVHNPKYTQQLLNDVSADIRAIRGGEEAGP